LTRKAFIQSVNDNGDPCRECSNHFDKYIPESFEIGALLGFRMFVKRLLENFKQRFKAFCPMSWSMRLDAIAAAVELSGLSYLQKNRNTRSSVTGVFSSSVTTKLARTDLPAPTIATASQVLAIII
jgi:hypothetical protein